MRKAATHTSIYTGRCFGLEGKFSLAHNLAAPAVGRKIVGKIYRGLR